MIKAFEETVRRRGAKPFFIFAEGGGDGPRRGEVAVTYAQARLSAIALASQMEREGMEAGAYVASDMDNCPSFIYLLLACSYGGYRLITLNHRLAEADKDERLASIEETTGKVPVLLTEGDVLEMVSLGRQAAPESRLVNLAQRRAALSKPHEQQVIMFTSGTTGAPKAAVLPGTCLVGSAYAFNGSLGAGESTMWQACLPLYHVGGLQVVVRSIMNRTPFVLYRRFEAARVLADAQRYKATHISVVDKTLRDLLDWAEKGVHGGVGTVRAYRCVLLGGSAPNVKTIAQAQRLEVPVVCSYGMTETASLVAACPVDEGDGRILHLLPGYEACVFEADDYGRGQLGIRGPGLFGGYLGLKPPFTADGYFLTGDAALLDGDALQVFERTQDMFVSGGENVYPEEVRRKLLDIEGVADAYVYGTQDDTWGRRPIALVEMAETEVGPGNAVALSHELQAKAAERLSRIYRPDLIFALPELPRRGIGKIDRVELERLAECRLDVRFVRIRRVSLPFGKPVRTAKADIAERESLIVEVVDAHGRTGIGEDVAFASDWYLPETIDAGLAFLKEQAVPCVLDEAFLHPSEAYAVLSALPGAEGCQMAICALEMALWDLYGKISKRPLRQLIGADDFWGNPGCGAPTPTGMAPGGVVLGIAPVEQTVREACEAAALGYRRIKLKIAPGDDVERVAAVREAVPGAMLMLDANQSYTELDMPVLRKLDALGCVGIEEPLDPHYENTRIGIIDRLANLQYQMKTTIFLDESLATPQDMQRALATRNIRGFVVKIGKCGGVQPALEFCREAIGRGARVWMGGMYDTGISKRLHAAFGMLSGVALPGDINDSTRYFLDDITWPPLKLANGNLLVNPPEAPYGLGCELNCEIIDAVTVESWDFGEPR